MNNREVEVRFLEIDKPSLLKKLAQLKAIDLGEELLYEVIFYDAAGTWQEQRKLVRLRKTKTCTILTYKYHEVVSVGGTEEIELVVGDLDKAKTLLEALGLVAYREQEKLRHVFKLGNVSIDIDTWPTLPSLVELEGETEDELKQTAAMLGLDWKNVVLKDQKFVIEEDYNIPLSKLKHFTFSKIE